MGGNIGKAIASMTIKQSYVGACVCVLTFKGTSCGTLCPPLQHPPDLLGPCDKQAEL